jgi:hypothetical protein
MTYPTSRRADVVQGSQQGATGPEPSSGVGPAFHLDEPAPYPRPLRSYLELGALPTAVPCARLHARHLMWEWGLMRLTADIELAVSELVTNAVRTPCAGRSVDGESELCVGGTHFAEDIYDLARERVGVNDRQELESGSTRV